MTIADLKPYPAVKESSVPWLEYVPEHWERMRLKRILRPVDHRSATGSETLLSLRRDHGVVVYAEHFSRPPQGATTVGFKLVRVGDLVVNRLQANNGLVFHSRLNGLVSPDYSVFEARVPVLMDYLSELLRTTLYRTYFRQESTGLGTGSAGFLRLYDNSFLDTMVEVPSVSEQVAIVRFLDYANRRIRRSIRAKQRLIKLLEEQKQAIINRAVTRGLNPNVRLKLSGVEWLGDVPEDWKVVRLRSLVSQVTSGSRGWSNFAAESGPLFIRIGNLTRASLGLDFSNAVRLSLPDAALSEGARTKVHANDILLSITAYIGSVAVVPEGIEDSYISQHVACCRPRIGAANARWVGYVLLSRVGEIHGRLCMYGGTKQGLSLDDVKNYVVLLPARIEQDALVEWIEFESKNTDRAIGAARREISLLREYGTRLIADVVTGKVDVRAAAAKLPDEVEEPESSESTDAFEEDDGNTVDDDLDGAREGAEA